MRTRYFGQYLLRNDLDQIGLKNAIMRASSVGLIIVAASLSAVATAATPNAGGGVAYYYGQVLFFSPDGKLPYGDTDAAVKREILDGGARIVETATQPGSSHGMRPKETITELKRRGETLVYDASDVGGTFFGTIVFRDPELKSWIYWMTFKAGGAMEGSGKLSPEGIKTEKHVFDGGRPMMLKGEFKVVSERVYKIHVNEMHPSRGVE